MHAPANHSSLASGSRAERETRHDSQRKSQGSTPPTANVLLIDDDPAVARLISRALEWKARVDLRFAVPQPGALALDGVDLVILDYKLPVRDGLDILEEIRSLDARLPVIFLTGFGTPDLAEQALAGGADAFMTKPVDLSRLEEMVDRLLEKTSQAAETRKKSREGARLDDDVLLSHVGGIKRFQARDQSGDEIRGSVTRFGYRCVFVEFAAGDEPVRGQELEEIGFRFGDQALACGRGFIGHVQSNSKSTFEAKVFLSGHWRVAVGESEQSEFPMAEFDDRAGLEDEWSMLPPDFRLAIFELVETLDTVQNRTRQFEATNVEGSDACRLEKENRFVSSAVSEYGALFWQAVQRFEAASKSITGPEKERVARQHARRMLYPFALGSPFLARVVERPIGVPGDFGMLGQILGDPYEGHSLYDRVVNAWILSCGAASAYRYRVSLLEREILGAVADANDEGRRARILSMASGVAYEVQRFVSCPPENRLVDFTLVDFSEATLREAERQYDSIGELPEGITLELKRSSVIDLANQSRGFGAGEGAENGFQPTGEYDLVYCAGLFDYLSDRLIRRVSAYLFGLVGPGGRLVLSNFTPENPICAWMTYVMDWDLIYRSTDEFGTLVRSAVEEDCGDFQIETTDDGVEAYALVRR